MVAALLITLREGLEAAIIISIILGILYRSGKKSRQREVWWGVLVAVAVSLVAGYSLYSLGVAFEGRAEEIFEGIAMLLAACVLTWMIFWMQSKGKNVQEDLEVDVQAAVKSESTGALFGLAFVAVVREGIETALFLTAAAFSTSPFQTIIGGFIGLALAILIGWLVFVLGKGLSIQLFFRVTGLLLLIFAAGLAAHGVHEFQEAGLLPILIEHIYDINPILDENTGLGLFMKTLFGYNGNPNLLESIVYVAYLGIILTLRNRYANKRNLLTAK